MSYLELAKHRRREHSMLFDRTLVGKGVVLEVSKDINKKPFFLIGELGKDEMTGTILYSNPYHYGCLQLQENDTFRWIRRKNRGIPKEGEVVFYQKISPNKFIGRNMTHKPVDFWIPKAEYETFQQEVLVVLETRSKLDSTPG